MSKKKKKEEPLTSKQREKVWGVINDCDDKMDRPAQEVIEKDFNGDEDAYLRRMAKFHGISLD